MIDIVQNTLDGLMVGSSYGLLALGFTLIFGVMRRLNLSYGPSIMIGAYLGNWLYVQSGAGPLAVAAAAVLGAVLAGIYVERLCFAPMGPAPASPRWCRALPSGCSSNRRRSSCCRATPILSAACAGAPLELGPFLLRLDHLVTLAARSRWRPAVQLVLYRSRFGLALRAIIGNPVAAQLVGIDVRAAVLGAFAAASALGGVAGFLVLAIDQQITPMFGMWATIKGLIAMMIGGLGSVPGAVLGGLLLGVIEAHSQWYFGPQIRDLVAYLVLFVVLVVHPRGLLGRTRSPKPDAAARA